MAEPGRGAGTAGARGASGPRVDGLLADGLARASIQGRWLVAGPLDRSAAALEAQGAEVVRWDRYAAASAGRGTLVAAAPPDGPWDGVVVRPWRGADATRLELHLLAGRLAPGGAVWAAAANDEGGRSLAAKLREVLSEVRDAVPGAHARRHVAAGPRPEIRAALDAWREGVTLVLPGGPRQLVSWPGLFAHGRLDAGTAVLLGHLPEIRGRRVLDFACGAGAIGAALAEAGPASLDLSDHDALAAHAAAHNVPSAQVHCADGIPPGGAPRWDVVVSNPPIHDGSDRDLAVIAALGDQLAPRLAPGGELRLVVQATVPVPRLLASLGAVERVSGPEERRFVVWSVRR